ncbi:hypothetical protein [Allocoleopsis franciscana]|nr:hypothetical protein [Allocoleopsis franciscana]
MTRKPTGKRLWEALYFLFPCLSMGSFSYEASCVGCVAAQEVMRETI